MDSRPDDPRLLQVRVFYETLSPAAVGRLGELYAPDARFKDPFNDVIGVPAIQAIFARMYRQVDRPRFVVTRAFGHGDDAFLAWEFAFCFRGQAGPEQTVRGATHIQFAADGRVAVHRDYWDAAEELYEKLPVLGWFMRRLKRRARH